MTTDEEPSGSTTMKPSIPRLTLVGAVGGAMIAATFVLAITVPPTIQWQIEHPATNSIDGLFVIFAFVFALVVGAVVGAISGLLGGIARKVTARLGAPRPAQQVACFVGAGVAAFLVSFILVPLFLPWNILVFSSIAAALAGIGIAGYVRVAGWLGRRKLVLSG